MTRVRRIRLLPTKLFSPKGTDGDARISLIWGAGQPNKLPLLGYLGALISGIAVCATFVSGYGWTGPIWVVALLSLIAAVAERGSISLLPDLDVSISLLPVVFAAVALGPVEAMIVAALSMATLPIPLMRWGVYTGLRALTGGVAGIVGVLTSRLEVDQAFVAVAITSLAVALTTHVLDAGLSGITALLRRVRLNEFMRFAIPQAVVSSLLIATVVGPLAYGYEYVSRWSIVLFLPPAIIAHRLFSLYREQRELAHDLGAANLRLERSRLSFARSLVAALDARDRYTAGHSAAVAIYTRDVASELHLGADAVKTAHLAGLLHDIGKVGIPPEVLEKPGPLTPEERLRMEEHPVIGERILENVEDYAEIAMIVRHHHERVDGKGYPDSIAGVAIPRISRIICVADAYNAMTSGRPYRGALPVAEARKRLRDGAGTQFDAEVVDTFLDVLTKGGDLYSRGATSHFAIEAQAHPVLDVTESSAA
jgi:putative nucleotidyltransferase with HDIG domain